MNPEYNSLKRDKPDVETETESSASLDDFIKELEAKERDLDISVAGTVVEIEEIDIENDEIAELEKLLESYQNNPPPETAITPISETGSLPTMPSANSLDGESARLRDELSKMSAERAELSESLRRQKNDFENFRKRTERERSESYRNILSNLAKQILPVVDNLTRALDSAAEHNTAKSQDFEQFITGIVLVNHQLNEVLEEMGVQPIQAVGQSFDPHFHEAVASLQTNDAPPNTVIEEILRGFRIEDKVIRPAMVKVSSANDADAGFSLEID